MRAFAAAILLAALAACATERAYEGAPRPAGELATIAGAPRVSAGLPLAAIIRKVDARRIGIGYSRATVEPGRHTLLVDCIMAPGHTTSRFEVIATVEAGRRYVLVAEAAPGNQRCGAVRLEER